VRKNGVRLLLFIQSAKVELRIVLEDNPAVLVVLIEDTA
jgi:hypothetical protein